MSCDVVTDDSRQRHCSSERSRRPSMVLVAMVTEMNRMEMEMEMEMVDGYGDGLMAIMMR